MGMTSDVEWLVLPDPACCVRQFGTVAERMTALSKRQHEIQSRLDAGGVQFDRACWAFAFAPGRGLAGEPVARPAPPPP